MDAIIRTFRFLAGRGCRCSNPGKGNWLRCSCGGSCMCHDE